MFCNITDFSYSYIKYTLCEREVFFENRFTDCNIGHHVVGVKTSTEPYNYHTYILLRGQKCWIKLDRHKHILYFHDV